MGCRWFVNDEVLGIGGIDNVWFGGFLCGELGLVSCT